MVENPNRVQPHRLSRQLMMKVLFVRCVGEVILWPCFSPTTPSSYLYLKYFKTVGLAKPQKEERGKRKGGERKEGALNGILLLRKCAWCLPHNSQISCHT